MGLVVRFVPPSLLGVLLLALAFFEIIPRSFDSGLVSQQQKELCSLTQMVCEMLTSYERQVKAGKLTLAEAQAEVIAFVREVRFGDDNKDYLWITDMHPHMLMHPYRPELDGQDVSDYADAHGKKLFMESVNVVRALPGGYVDYTWQSPDNPQRVTPALSYVRGFAPWGWIVGTGRYSDGIPVESRAMRSKLAWASGVILGTFTLLSLLQGWHSFKSEQNCQQAEHALTLNLKRQVRLKQMMQEDLFGARNLQQKLQRITDAIVDVFDADFCRIWVIAPGELCSSGCIHAATTEGPEVCRDRSRCLHLWASSGRYTHIDGGHRRIPFGCYTIGRVAADNAPKFLTNDVQHDGCVQDHSWAARLQLVSFAGYRLFARDGAPLGVLALFAKHPLSPDEDNMLEGVAAGTSHIIQSSQAQADLEQAHRELEIRVRQRTSELADTNDRLQTEVVERKKAEEGLRESEARHRAITEAAEDAIITADCAGRIRFWNAAAERIFGYVAAEVVGRNMMDFIVPSRYGEAKHKELMEFARTGDGSAVGHRLELSALRKSGSEFPIELSLSRYRDDTGYVAVALVRDISDRKQTQATLERMHSELVEASHQAGMAEVATGVLHNVGNVLNSANVSTELAIQGVRKISVSGLAKVVALIDEHKDDLGRFVTADDKGRHVPTYLAELCRHLAFEQTGVLNELASLASSIDHIKHIVSMQQRYAGGFGAAEPVALADVLDDAIKMKAAACARHHIHVIREYEDIPDMVLEKHLLLQIVVNLLSNAMGALRDCDQADKTVSVRFHREGERGVRVDVRDNGMGISKEDLTSVFQYGFTTKKDGHGFGLHNSALAAQAMGGSLTAHSDGPGQGATFALVLPLKTLEAKQCKTVGST